MWTSDVANYAEHVSGGRQDLLQTADYYSEGQELEGRWRGKGAELLGLTGVVKKADWDALCDNRNPADGEQLTLRQKKNRRVGFDFNFHVPKSVSVLYSQTKDDRILDAFRESVDDTMRDMEAEMKTRVRKSGKDDRSHDRQHDVGRVRAFHGKAGWRRA